MPITTRRRTTRIVLTLLQIVVMLSYVMAPFSAFADEPTPDPSQPAASEPPISSEAPGAVPTESATASPAPTEEPAPATPAPLPATPAPAPATPAPSEPPSEAPVPALPAGSVPFIVSFAPGTSEARQAQVIADAGVTDESSIPQLAMHGVLLHEGLVADEAAALRANADVLRVEQDRTREAGAVPSDSDFGSQWALAQVGWTDLYGSVAPVGNATVAILDTGFDGSHWDLDQVVLSGTSLLDGGNGLIDPHGHGTAMAGIVAAETDNAFGVAGTAYAGVSLLPVTVLDANGLGQDSDIIAGVVYAADAGADVILMSFSNPGYSPALQAALDYAWSKGAVLVAAVGNDGSTSATYPAGDRGVIGVAATDSTDALGAGSNAGAAAFLAAPGVDILTTALGGGFAPVSGSSASAAQVAGAAGLLAALDPAASNGTIVGRLARNADPAASEGLGNGRLNMARAAADPSTDAIQPTGAAPLGTGGPIVGPYVAAAQTIAGSYDAGTRDVSWTASAVNANQCYRVRLVRPNGTLFAQSAMFTTVTAKSGSFTLSAGEPVGNWVLHLDRDSACNGNFNNLSIDTFTFVVANAAPVANNDTYAANEDTTLTVGAPGVLGNDTDADGNTLTAQLVTGPSSAQGALTLNANGSFTFAPAANFNGSTTFTYIASDGTATSNTATVTITVSTVDDAPVAVDDASTVGEDSGTNTIDVLANDTDVDGGLKIVASVTQGSNGTVTVAPGGANANYTPNVNYCGSDTFSYTLNGGSTATVAMTVMCANDPPVAVDDLDETDEDVALVIDPADLRANDSDVDTATLTVTTVGNPVNGTVARDEFSGSITFTPAANFNGEATFEYTVSDGSLSDSATVTITVAAVNDAPVAVADEASTNEDTAVDIDVILNDTDVEDDSLSVASFDASSAEGGTVSLNLDGTLHYTPAANFNGTDSFTYTASDGTDDSNSATVTITVAAVNDAPVLAAIGNKAIAESSTLTFMATATDVESNSLAFSLGPSAPASATIDPVTGEFSWTPADNQTVTFTVIVTDNGTPALSDDEEITVTVTNVAPTATFNAPTPVVEGSAISLSLADPSDPSPVDQAAGFTFAFDCGTPAGYSPFTSNDSASCPTNDNGTRTVRGTIKDKDGGTTEYTRSVAVSNAAPVIQTATLSLNSASGVVTSSVQWTDAGSADAETVTFTYRNGASVIATATYSGKPANSFQGDTQDFGPGCYNLSVTIDVTDDDGGTDQELRSQASADVYAATFDAPIMQNERNIVKYGNVVPVKVRLASSCTGALTNAPTLYITVAQGITIDTYGSEVIVESVSNADTGQQMRPIDSKYMYNLSTKGLQANTNYEIRIRAGAIDGPIIAQAHLYPKK